MRVSSCEFSKCIRRSRSSYNRSQTRFYRTNLHVAYITTDGASRFVCEIKRQQVFSLLNAFILSRNGCSYIPGGHNYSFLEPSWECFKESYVDKYNELDRYRMDIAVSYIYSFETCKCNLLFLCCNITMKAEHGEWGIDYAG